MEVSYGAQVKGLGRWIAVLALVAGVIIAGTFLPGGGVVQAVAQAPAEAPAVAPPMAAAPLSGAARPMGFMETISSLLPMFAMVYLIFYFLVTRPQQQKLQAHAKLLEDLKKGEQVLTTGGLIGRIVSRESDHVVLDIGGGSRVKVDPAALSRRWEPTKSDGDGKEKAEGKSSGGRDAQAKNS